jgi:hypothetical protein
MRGKPNYEYIKWIESERNKTLPPGSRWHQYWCAIFEDKPCDCDDEDRGREHPLEPYPRKGGRPAMPAKRALEEEPA